MDDANDTNQATGSAGEANHTQATEAGGANVKTFTQADVDRIVGERVARERRERQQTPARTPATSDGDSTERVTLKQLQQRLEETELRGRFDKRAARLGFDDETADELFEVVRAKPPEDLGAWLEKKAKVFGLGTNKTPPAPNPATAAPAAAPKAPAAPTSPRAVDPINSGGHIDVWKLSPDDLARMRPEDLRRNHEAIKADHYARLGAPPLPRGLAKR